jgi:hypothetical protein
MSTRGVRERLEHVTLPDAAGARRRAWAVAADAYAQQAPVRRSWQWPVGALAALTLAVIVAAVALTPPGAAVAGWVRRALGAEAPAPRTTLGPLPAAGRLLVTSRSGAWIVARDGARMRLGAFTGATWSPRGLYVAGWHGRSLSAVAPDGRVAWSYAAPGPIRDVRWSPDGFRIAYRSGRHLAVVAGDGSGARILDATPGRAALAWRPTEAHTLAWVDRDGRVVVRDVDSGRLVWRSPSGAGAATDLAWSADGRRLMAREPRLVRVLDVRAGRWSQVAAGAGAGRRIRAAAWAPSGQRLALIVGEADGSSAVLVTDRLRSGLPGRRLFATTGTLGPLAWSPDGRRLLVGWRDADEWLFLPAGGRARPSAVAQVARRFGGAPVVRGWCCGP